MATFVIILLSGLLFLSACGGKHPEALKPSEPGRLKRSQKPYTVNGERYEPLRTHEGFVQEGIASWYGKDFHGRPTSSGEPYDMHAMTAAHKTLPLGVYVKVHNKYNHREAIVRVNDRGPFVRGRVIDLSYGAAKKLGVVEAGTVAVRVEALGYRVDGPAGQDQYEAPATYDAGTFTVQIGSFTDQNNAKRLSALMKNLFGYTAIVPAEVKGERFYRVYAGKYSSLREAEKAEKNFSEHGYPGSFTVSLE